jgi:hypothetical protein
VRVRKAHTDNFEDIMAAFKPLATKGFSLDAIEEELDEVEEERVEEDGEAKWDPTRRELWEEKILIRRKVRSRVRVEISE